jgi:ankyrin repeat protein
MKWLLCAQRPLQIAEFIAAVAVYSGEQSPTLCEAEVLSICCNVVVLDSEQKYFRFAHLSVREYLERLGDYTPFTTHTLALERCLDVLMFGQTTAESAVRGGSKFQQYADLYWPVHYQSVIRNQLTEGLPKKLMEFIFQEGDTSPSFTKWASGTRQSSRSLQWTDPLINLLRATSSTPPTPLFLTCSFGLVSIMDELGTFANVNWNQRNDDGNTGLHLAARNGHETVIQLLLEKGADVDSKDRKYGRTPLSWAATKGNKAVVQLLLEKGADIEDKEYGQTPLFWAAENGNEAVMQLILEKGAEIDLKDTEYGRTPLSWVAENGHKAVIQLLLEKGAEIDSKDKRYGRTPLSWAAKNGRKAVIQLLLEKGADIDSRDTEYGRTQTQGIRNMAGHRYYGLPRTGTRGLCSCLNQRHSESCTSALPILSG